MVGDTRQGWAVLAAMTVIFVGLLIACVVAEQNGHVFVKQGVDHAASALQSGGNMEGKETASASPIPRCGRRPRPPPPTARSTRCTTRSRRLGGLVPMWLMQLGEVVFGGVGSGLYGMLMFAIIAVFVAGLMVGRTPEYLGKKIEAYEMKMASLVILIPPVLVLIGTSIAVVTGRGQGRHRQSRRSTGSARSCTPSPRRATTTAAPSPG